MPAPPPPNVVFIIMDDLGFGDLRCHGNPWVQTPELDSLRRESVRLTRYCSGPVCTPARAALMTGRHPYRTRAIDTYLGRSMIDPGERTLAEVLRDAGYATGIFGKWHLGDCHPVRAMDKGFAEALVHNGGGLRQPGNVTHFEGGDAYLNPDLMHNGALERHEGYCTDIFADAAVRWIEQQRRGPFFCYLGANAPHTPLEIAEEWWRPYAALGLPEPFARLYGMVQNIDANVGRVLAKLDELALRENTIVVYTSDHGPCPSARLPDRRSRYNAGLRDLKGTLYEGGIRVPCFIRWPARLGAGVDVDRLANPIDWLPTLAAACGARLPDDRALDGVNLLPLLTGRTPPAQWPDRAIPMQWHRGDAPERYRNAGVIGQRFKLYWPCPHGGLRDPIRPAELYDTTADPGEAHDLAPQQPELVARLREVYDRWFDEVSSTRPDNFNAPAIHVGTAHEDPTVLTRQDWRIVGPDGWSDEHLGYWRIRVATDGPLWCRLRFAAATEPGVLCFQCGPARRQVPVAIGQAEARCDDLRLGRGDLELYAWLGSGGRQRGVRRVDLGRDPR